MNQEQRDILEAAFGSLPEKEGYELVGVKMKKVEKGNIILNDNANKWVEAEISFHEFSPTAIFNKLEPAPQPTTLRDLMPEGNENVYLHNEKGAAWATQPMICADGTLKVAGAKLCYTKEKGFRWSHSIHTPYEEANEFVA